MPLHTARLVRRSRTFIALVLFEIVWISARSSSICGTDWYRSCQACGASTDFVHYPTLHLVSSGSFCPDTDPALETGSETMERTIRWFRRVWRTWKYVILDVIKVLFVPSCTAKLFRCLNFSSHSTFSSSVISRRQTFYLLQFTWVNDCQILMSWWKAV